MASAEKRCLYEILGLRIDCLPDEIRSAYKKLALQRHPDKLIKSGVTEAEATASFQELVNAYEVLSDPRERSWYDSHRSQILFSNPNSSTSNTVPDLFSFFSNSVFSGYSDTGKGFYKVYADVFDKIYQNELNFANKLGLGPVKEAPLMGNVESLYSQVNAFYGYWLGFVSVMDFVWVDQYDAMAGPNRKSRRVMEDENKKLRKKAKREYNETVRGLAEFVKKRDKRVIDMQVKRNEEMERKKAEEVERKKQLEREKAERLRAYEEPDWAKVEEVDVEEEVGEEAERKKELYCVICGKKFKSEKQWKNHEQSKKHKDKAAELREAMSEEEIESEEGEEVLDGEVNELQEQFENGVGIQENKHDDDDCKGQSSEEDVFVDIDNGGGAVKGIGKELESDDVDEDSILDAMVSGHKSRKNVGKTSKPQASSLKVQIEVAFDERDFMEYNNSKGATRKRGKKQKGGKRADKEGAGVDVAEISSQAEENNGDDGGSHMVKESSSSSSSHSFAENDGTVNGDDQSEMTRKVSKQAVDKKGVTKKDMNARGKNASRGKKEKATSISKSSSHVCDKCGEEFESRTKLHKHLSDAGHASLKSR